MRFLSRLRSDRALTPKQAADDDSLLIVDVRERAEYATGHAPGATNIPLASLPSRLSELSGQDRAVAFVCRSGQRSARATALAQDSGLQARNISGGMLAWQRAGLPMTEDSPSAGA